MIEISHAHSGPSSIVIAVSDCQQSFIININIVVVIIAISINFHAGHSLGSNGSLFEARRGPAQTLSLSLYLMFSVANGG